MRYLQHFFISSCLFVWVGGLSANLQLPLRGSAQVNAAWFFSICEMRLYTEPSTVAENVLDGRPLSLEIEYLRSISADTLIRYGNKGLDESFGHEVIKSFQAEIDLMNQAYVDVDKGDIYRLDFSPESGLTLSLNGSKVITINDGKFALFYLAIWLGENRHARSTKQKIFKS